MNKDNSLFRLINDAREKGRLVEMHLQMEPYQMIRSGIKIYEIRLNDEKRQELKEGDIIRFIILGDESGECLYASIAGFKHYISFKSLYKADSDPDDELTLYRCGFNKNISSEDFLKTMKGYYTREKEEKYGALIIELERIKLES